jgi:hypothetical protein
MKNAFLALSCLALLLLGALIVGAGFGEAQSNMPVENARPTPTPDGKVLPEAQLPPDTDLSPDIPPLPDLIVEDISVEPSVPFLGEATIIRVTIKNQGTKDLPVANTFYTDLYIDPGVVPIRLGQDGQHSWGCQDWYVPAGGSYTLLAAHIFTDVKTYALYAQVDTDGGVGESIESNNVMGPVHIDVRSRNKLVHETHQDFQMGLASGLDVTHPQGVIRYGIWREPWTEPEVYYPDTMINDITGTFTVEYSHTTVNQIRPALVGDGQGRLFAIWEDGRNGGVYNTDIYFSASFDRGTTWTQDELVNDDHDLITNTVRQGSPDLAYDPSIGAQGRLYAVWQDSRNNPEDFDIYFAYSDDYGANWSDNVQLNDIGWPGHQMNPSIALGPLGGGAFRRIYVVWQDQRNGNDDVYLARSDDGGLTWGSNYFVTDDPQMTQQDQRSPSVDVTVDAYDSPLVFVCWEDWRIPDHPDIYCSMSDDRGESYVLDVPVTYPEQGTSYRVEPTMVVSTYIESRDEWDPILEMTITVQITVLPVHVAWQEGKDDDADIYWAYATLVWDEDRLPDWTCPYPYYFCFESPVEVSGFVIDSDYVLPPDKPPSWPIDPTWQGQASLSLAPPFDFTWCHADSTEVYSNGLYVAWSDARTFDDWRYEIRTRRIASPEGDPETYETCEDSAAGVVNDDAKLYGYRNNLDDYEDFKPAATGQFNPSVYRDPTGFYVAWDDDRWDKPLKPGVVRNRDVLFTRSEVMTRAIYISPVIDSRTQSSWYVLSWWGATDYQGDLLLQTRFGENPYPPQIPVTSAAGITATGWTPWTGNPSSPYLGCDAGAGCFYDAPGRHIVDPSGNTWFDCPGPNCPEQYQYMQYKVIIQCFYETCVWPGRLTALSQVTIHYRGLNTYYLPIVRKLD